MEAGLVRARTAAGTDPWDGRVAPMATGCGFRQRAWAPAGALSRSHATDPGPRPDAANAWST